MMRSFISSAALVAAMAISGGVAAQDTTVSADAMTSVTVNGVLVEGDDVARVQRHCDQLFAEANTGATGDDDGEVNEGNDDDSSGGSDGDADGDDGDSDGSDDSTSGDDEPGGEVDGIDQALTTIDLETVTLEACIEAGLVGNVVE